MKNILTVASGFMKTCGFDFTLNPALGCAFGCSYCYAEAFTQSMSPGEQWGEWTKLKLNAGALIKSQASLRDKKIYMASVTDPYQPAEREAQITRGVLQALLAHHAGFTLVVQTRGPLVTRDIDLLLELAKENVVQVNVSVTTDSESVRREFEPTCPSIAQRLGAVRTLIEAGVRTVVTATPMLPLEDTNGFATTLAKLGIAYAVIQPFHAPQAGREGVRGTRSAADELLIKKGITRASLVAQGNDLRDALEGRGVRVGMGESGFAAP